MNKNIKNFGFILLFSILCFGCSSVKKTEETKKFQELKTKQEIEAEKNTSKKELPRETKDSIKVNF